jgi:uncharacterized membrane protein YfcA
MKTSRPYWWSTFVTWLAVATLMGIVGAFVSRYLGAPAYFGGIFGFCLFGLAGLFALADRITKKS